METRSSQAEKTNDYMPEGQKRFKQDSVLLEPGIARRIGLGAYSKAEPEPKFMLAFEPKDMERHVRVAFDTMDIPGSSRTLYFCVLLNSSNKRCRVTIALRGGEKK